MVEATQPARGEIQPRRSTLIITYGALGLLFVFSFFHNLDQRLLWGDEAETADLALNILRGGVPMQSDGRNTISLYGPAIDSGHGGVWTWSPWLQEYVCAASMKIFGNTTWAARAPFTLVSLIAGVWLATILFRLYRSHTLTALFLTLYGTCTPLLLHARQCRYYGLLMLSSVVLAAGFLRLGKTRDWRGSLLITLGLTLQFYSNYMLVPGSLGALGLSVLILRRNRSAILGATVSVVAFAVLALPWVLFAEPWKQQGDALDAGGFLRGLAFYAPEIQHHIIAWPIAIVMVTALVKIVHARRNAASRDVSDFYVFAVISILSSLFTLSLVSVRFFRYLTPTLPLLLAAASVAIASVIPWRWAQIAVVLAVVSSNALSMFPRDPRHPFSMPFVAFAHSITHPYDDRFRAVLTYLRAHSKPGQSVWVGDSEFPLIFYSDLKIVNGRFPELLSRTPSPDWVLSESPGGVDTMWMRPPPGPYRRIAIPVPATDRVASVPEPHMYIFKSATSVYNFELYERVTTE